MKISLSEAHVLLDKARASLIALEDAMMVEYGGVKLKGKVMVEMSKDYLLYHLAIATLIDEIQTKLPVGFKDQLDENEFGRSGTISSYIIDSEEARKQRELITALSIYIDTFPEEEKQRLIHQEAADKVAVLRAE